MESAAKRLIEPLKGDEQEVIHVVHRSSVIEFLKALPYLLLFKSKFRLHYATFEIFIYIVNRCYSRNIGCSVTYLSKIVYGSCSSAGHRNINGRLSTLRSKGYIRSERRKGVMLHYLTDKAKEMLGSVEAVEL